MGWDGLDGGMGRAPWVWDVGCGFFFFSGGMIDCDDICDQGCVYVKCLVMGLRVWGLGFDSLVILGGIDEFGDHGLLRRLFGELRMGCLLGLVVSR